MVLVNEMKEVLCLWGMKNEECKKMQNTIFQYGFYANVIFK